MTIHTYSIFEILLYVYNNNIIYILFSFFWCVLPEQVRASHLNFIYSVRLNVFSHARIQTHFYIFIWLLCCRWVAAATTAAFLLLQQLNASTSVIFYFVQRHSYTIFHVFRKFSIFFLWCFWNLCVNAPSVCVVSTREASNSVGLVTTDA